MSTPQNALAAWLTAARNARLIRDQANEELRQAMNAANLAHDAKIKAAYDALDAAYAEAHKEAQESESQD